jgi:hypothetical protein
MRLQGAFPVAVDGTGFLSFHQQHCPHCLVHRHETHTVYLHPVLEAKLVDPRGLALSIATEFIENPTPPATPATPLPTPVKSTQEAMPTLTTYETVKQDCELKAFARLAEQLKAQFPQTPFCLGGDSLQDYATTPVGLFGSLKNIAKRLLECFRYFSLTDQDFEAYPGQIRLCDPG